MSERQKATSIQQFGVARPSLPLATPAVPPARLPERDKPCYDERFSYVNCQPMCRYKSDAGLKPGCPLYVDPNRRLGDGWNAPRKASPSTAESEVA